MIQTGICTQRALTDHPCFYGSAKARWGRVHLPVAPHCNIQCNFCNRLYDCANESRPAVTRGILESADAPACLDRLLNTRSDISVVGIAGPGDPMCEPERTLEVLRAVHSSHPDLLVCISTNGLNLTGYIDDLAEAGVTHVTVTINAVDPLIGSRIYSRITFNNNTYRGVEAAELLLSRQREGIAKLKSKGFVVKINVVVIPGINMDHIETIAEEASCLGADLMNCIPMIPISGTTFEHMRAPTDGEIERIRDSASHHISQMYHCRRCRADAVGRLCSAEGHLSLLTQ
jgi:nitrogen fixation protein NifB